MNHPLTRRNSQRADGTSQYSKFPYSSLYTSLTLHPGLLDAGGNLNALGDIYVIED